jgi:hypothetical protein
MSSKCNSSLEYPPKYSTSAPPPESGAGQRRGNELAIPRAQSSIQICAGSNGLARRGQQLDRERAVVLASRLNPQLQRPARREDAAIVSYLHLD